MKQYRYEDVVKITSKGIVFRDGYELIFEECIQEWSNINNIKTNETVCVAERDASAFPMYFMFYSKEKTRLAFEKKGFLSKKKNYTDFNNVRITLNKYGFTSYDMS